MILENVHTPILLMNVNPLEQPCYIGTLSGKCILLKYRQQPSHHMNIFCRLLKRNIYKEKERNIYTNKNVEALRLKSAGDFQECPCLIFENAYVLRAVQLACSGGS